MVTATKRDAGTVHVLDERNGDVLRQLAQNLLVSGRHRVDDPEWVNLARRKSGLLPASLRQRLTEFRRDSGASGTLLLRSVPFGAESLPDTPRSAGSVQERPTISAAVLLMIACALGDPAAFRAEKNGALVQDVVPVPGKEKFQGNAGSTLLTFHNENAFHEHRPDFVMLLCLRADHEGEAGLRVACVRQVLPLLAPGTTAELSSPEFVTEPPPSFGAQEARSRHPVFSGCEDPDIRVDFAATSGCTEPAREAMAELRQAVDEVAETIFLRPGELAIVDNRVAVHGRTPFTPRYDGKDRWLQRTFALADLRRSRNCRPGDGYVLTN